jgi:hypothetical protein
MTDREWALLIWAQIVAVLGFVAYDTVRLVF